MVAQAQEKQERVTIQRGQSRQSRNYTIDPSGGGGDPTCPPEDIYAVQLEKIVDLGYAKTGFDGKDPELQFTLEFRLLDYVDDDGQIIDKTVRGYYTPKMHQIEGYNPPKLYMLCKAFNGGVPYPMPVNEEGYLLPYDPDDCWDILDDLIASGQNTCRMSIGPGPRGWAKILKGDPLPVRAKRQQPGKPTNIRVVEPEPVVEEDDDTTDSNF